MEIELKYMIDNKYKFKEIINYLSQYNPSVIHMKAEYYDTEDFALKKSEYALRIRSEGEKNILTIKTKGSQSNGFFKREEVNIDLTGMDFDLSEQLKSSEIGRNILMLCGCKEIKPCIITEFDRIKAIAEISDCCVEIAVDSGSITTNSKKAPISELEIELISGKPDNLCNIGNFFSQKFNLAPECKSKYERGLELLKKSF